VVFSSVTFLFAFLPATLAVYFAAPRRFGNAVLIAASLTFYVWGAGRFVVVFLATTFLDYLLALLIDRARGRGATRSADRWLAVSVIANLGVLGWFKYAMFAADLLSSATGSSWSVGRIALPLAISFFTFQRMSYVIDVRRGDVEAVHRFDELLLCVCLFPHLIAGPIVRFAQLRDEIHGRTRSVEMFADGAVRFSWGLAKKVIVADALAPVAAAAFDGDLSKLGTLSAVLGLLAYTLQIYFDFSGYSDMAIGLAAMLGFHFPENFDRPYSSASMTEFWRRWHMSLSSWFRDYLYVPLGGNQRGERRVLLNLLIVFFVTGLWHGANMTFVVWGLYHGAWLLAERLTGRRDGRAAVVRRIVTAGIVMIGWVFFRSADLGRSIEYLHAIVRGGATLTPGLAVALGHRAMLTLAAAALVFAIPARHSTVRVLRQNVAVRTATCGLALPLSALFVAAGSFSPFLYFKF